MNGKSGKGKDVGSKQRKDKLNKVGRKDEEYTGKERQTQAIIGNYKEDRINNKEKKNERKNKGGSRESSKR